MKALITLERNEKLKQSAKKITGNAAINVHSNGYMTNRGRAFLRVSIHLVSQQLRAGISR